MVTVSTTFAGTSEAAAGIPGVRPDKVELFRFAGDEKFTVTRDGTPAAFTGFYDTEKLARRDQYAVFLGGNAGVTEVRQGENDPRPVLLLYRDSYGNALIPFLARHFRILAVDPRYTAAPLASFSDGALVKRQCSDKRPRVFLQKDRGAAHRRRPGLFFDCLRRFPAACCKIRWSPVSRFPGAWGWEISGTRQTRNLRWHSAFPEG